MEHLNSTYPGDQTGWITLAVVPEWITANRSLSDGAIRYYNFIAPYLNSYGPLPSPAEMAIKMGRSIDTVISYFEELNAAGIDLKPAVAPSADQETTRKPKMPINIARALRKQIASRDGWSCRYCRIQLTEEFNHPTARKATLDHVIPVSKDGPDDLDNLVLACGPCNSGKGNRVLEVQA